MKISKYIYDKKYALVAVLFLEVCIFSMGYAFKANSQYMIALGILLFVLFFGVEGLDYLRRKKFYDDFLRTLEHLDQKYLITDMEIKPVFEEGKILLDSLYDIDKSMKEHMNDREASISDFKEYLELWIHEIKMPIAALALMNYNETTDFAKQKNQIDKLSYYVEQILFYARADAAEKDFLLKECNLEQIINKVVKEQKDILIGNRISIQKENVDFDVVTDAKWMEYLIGQIISNSVKYKNPGKKSYIKFYANREKDEVTVIIEDNGIGIPAADLPRIFEKTFTGENGRKGSVSTGMGLYICEKLCKKLGHRISVESEQGEYTKVKVTFGNDYYYDVR